MYVTKQTLERRCLKHSLDCLSQIPAKMLIVVSKKHAVLRRVRLCVSPSSLEPAGLGATPITIPLMGTTLTSKEPANMLSPRPVEP